MKRKKGNSFEQHIDMIVIGVSVLISLWLLWVFVLSNPYGEEVAGRKIGPGRIDEALEPQAQQLQQILDAPPAEVQYSGQEGTVYREIFANSIQKVPPFRIPLPGFGSELREAKRIYQLPEIPNVSDVAVEGIRTVVHVPTEEVDREITYSQVPTKLGDMDLVSVQGTFDIPRLAMAFRQSFAHPRMKPEWIDEKLASPVFAAVDLERREQNPNGTWSEWVEVGPTKINAYKKLFLLPQTVSDLDISLPVKMDLFRSFEVQREVLQPTPYDIAVQKEKWLAPTYHAEYSKMIEKEDMEARRAEMERKRQEADRERESRNRVSNPNRNRPTPNQPTQPDRDRQTADRNRRGMNPGEAEYMGLDPSGRPLLGGRPKPAERGTADVINDFEKKRLLPGTDLSKLRDPMLFWAHDDSIQKPGTYQYRVRVGVFNPIAGKGWLAEEQTELSDQVILWTSYSSATEPVVVEPMHYFFPQKFLADEGKLEIKVSKYHLGQWRSDVFQVQPGEPIGKIADAKPLNPVDDPSLRGMTREEMAYMGSVVDPLQNLPQNIDFSTGAIYVDLITTTHWVGSSAQGLQEMLYSSDGMSLQQMAVESRFWPSDLQSKQTQIKTVESDQPLQFVGRGQSGQNYMRPPVPYDRGRDRMRPGDVYGTTPGGVPIPH